ncbi:MAG: exodeoxyribonuclease VII small subunit [Gammaproteobacteria bacterium]|nr:MAG: exodeoxyribonuclease VII small subunit [Gammaproteobacteria bacterium]
MTNEKITEATTVKTTEKTYEVAIAELEKILSQLENNDLPLEAAIKQFESGVALIKHCQAILDNTEQKIKGLMDTPPESIADSTTAE